MEVQYSKECSLSGGSLRPALAIHQSSLLPDCSSKQPHIDLPCVQYSFFLVLFWKLGEICVERFTVFEILKTRRHVVPDRAYEEPWRSKCCTYFQVNSWAILCASSKCSKLTESTWCASVISMYVCIIRCTCVYLMKLLGGRGEVASWREGPGRPPEASN